MTEMSDLSICEKLDWLQFNWVKQTGVQLMRFHCLHFLREHMALTSCGIVMIQWIQWKFFRENSSLWCTVNDAFSVQRFVYITIFWPSHQQSIQWTKWVADPFFFMQSVAIDAILNFYRCKTLHVKRPWLEKKGKDKRMRNTWLIHQLSKSFVFFFPTNMQNILYFSY